MQFFFAPPMGPLGNPCPRILSDIIRCLLTYLSGFSTIKIDIGDYKDDLPSGVWLVPECPTKASHRKIEKISQTLVTGVSYEVLLP